MATGIVAALVRKSAIIDRLFAIIVGALGLVSTYFIFMLVPNERVMGAIQRIFYFHVGAAIASYCAIALIVVGAVMYLATRESTYDALGQAAAEVALVMCSVVLVSGMIWGYVAWNTWFRWEPRLVSFLLLWLMLLSLVLLRSFGDQQRIGNHAAILGILSAITVPLVIASVRLLPESAQLHPRVVETQGLRDARFVYAMLLSMVTLSLFSIQIIWIRLRIELLKRGAYAHR